MKILLFCFCLFTFSSQAQFAKYVNPFIGTGGTGHTFPGATTPFAMVQLSPDTRIDGSWEGCSGYHFNDSIIYGFSHTHLSGTGCSDYGDIAFMPYFSKTDEFEKLKTENIQAKFSHKNEKASAGYYSVVLEDIPVKVELTATTRTGFQRYTFNEDGYGYIVLNLKHRDELLEGKIHHPIFDTLLTCFRGIRRSKAWAKNQVLYYASIMQQTPEKYFIVKEGANDTKLILQYKVRKGQEINIITGISTVDEDAALNNLAKENPSWEFEKIKLQAQQQWEKELKKIEVTSPQPSPKERENLIIFYTAMYHCMIHPSIMNDVDGRYKGRDGKIHKAEGFNYYTVFSLWDTHRALHPLLNIIDKKRSHDFVITFLKQFEQSGRLPMWELWNNETDCMIGFHAVSVILDAYRKQVITKDELKQLWPAVKAGAMSNRFGLDKFREKGFLSVEDESESVSKTLEYSYDMWCVAEIAKETNERKDEEYFRQYQDAWKEMQNQETGFMQPRKNGNWLQPFNPFEVNNNYTEANAWQYSFYQPQWFLANEDLLDSLFKATNQIEGRNQADITGLIGQYAHGNEPSHSYIYLLSNIDDRIKYLKYVYENFYTNKPDGLIGNEDCGQMSAWYVMSALGFYQTCPGNPQYIKGYSLFDSSAIILENGGNIKLKNYFAHNPSEYKTIINNKDALFAYSMMQNVQHNMVFPFTNKDNLNYFTFNKVEKSIIPFNILTPLIVTNSYKVFSDSILVELKTNYSEKSSSLLKPNIVFSLNGSEINQSYSIPFYIKKSSTIYAKTIVLGNEKSKTVTAHFYKRPHNYSIQLNSKYNKQYTADGDDGIIDGQYGDIDWRKGGWQGYQSQDFEAVIDMKEIKQFAEISANFLQDSRSWILFPKKVEFYISNDSINYTLVQTSENNIAANDNTVQTQKFVAAYVDRSIKIEPPGQKKEIMRTARYIKVKAYNYGALPKWHQGFGGDAFIFIDEIEVK